MKIKTTTNKGLEDRYLIKTLDGEILDRCRRIAVARTLKTKLEKIYLQKLVIENIENVEKTE